MEFEMILAGQTLVRTYLTLGLSVVFVGCLGMLVWLWRPRNTPDREARRTWREYRRVVRKARKKGITRQ